MTKPKKKPDARKAEVRRLERERFRDAVALEVLMTSVECSAGPWTQSAPSRKPKGAAK